MPIYLSAYLYYYFEVFLVNVAISCLLQLHVNPDVIRVIYFCSQIKSSFSKNYQAKVLSYKTAQLNLLNMHSENVFDE